MKNLLNIWGGLVVCCCFMFSCNDDNKDFIGFKLDKTEITIGAEGGSEKILVQ